MRIKKLGFLMFTFVVAMMFIYERVRKYDSSKKDIYLRKEELSGRVF